MADSEGSYGLELKSWIGAGYATAYQSLVETGMDLLTSEWVFQSVMDKPAHTGACYFLSRACISTMDDLGAPEIAIEATTRLAVGSAGLYKEFKIDGHLDGYDLIANQVGIELALYEYRDENLLELEEGSENTEIQQAAKALEPVNQD